MCGKGVPDKAYARDEGLIVFLGPQPIEHRVGECSAVSGGKGLALGFIAHRNLEMGGFPGQNDVNALHPEFTRSLNGPHFEDTLYGGFILKIDTPSSRCGDFTIRLDDQIPFLVCLDVGDDAGRGGLGGLGKESGFIANADLGCLGERACEERRDGENCPDEVTDAGEVHGVSAVGVRLLHGALGESEASDLNLVMGWHYVKVPARTPSSRDEVNDAAKRSELIIVQVGQNRNRGA